MIAPERRPHLPALTSLRFVAALWVVFFHFGREFLALAEEPARDLQKIGYVGVSFFFVLSGFVLAYTYSGRTFTPGTFWRARFARIYPVYLVIMALSGPIALKTQPLEVAMRLFALQAWFPSHVGDWNFASWSISAEAFFYLLFPFALPLIERFRRPQWWVVGFALLAVLPPLLWVIFREPGPPTSVATANFPNHIVKFWPPLRLAEFLAGVAAGVAFVRFGPPKRAGWGWLVGLIAVGLAATFRSKVPWEVLHNGLLTLPFVAVIVAAAAGKGTVASLLSYRVPVFLGEISYALYLVHMPLHGLMKKVVPLDARAFFLVYLVVAIAAASVLHLMIERPARRWLRGK